MLLKLWIHSFTWSEKTSFTDQIKLIFVCEPSLLWFSISFFRESSPKTNTWPETFRGTDSDLNRAVTSIRPPPWNIFHSVSSGCGWAVLRVLRICSDPGADPITVRRTGTPHRVTWRSDPPPCSGTETETDRLSNTQNQSSWMNVSGDNWRKTEQKCWSWMISDFWLLD